MPARKQPRSVAEQVHEEIEQEIHDLVTQIAAEEGPAPHAQYVSDEHEVDLWGQMDSKVDYDTLVQQLMAGQVPPELVDPMGDRPLALVKASPELAQLFAEPLDQEMASMLATLAEYPYRLSLLAPYTDDPEASVKKADSLTGRWKRRRDTRVAQPVALSEAEWVQPAPVPAAPVAPPPGAQEPLGVPSSPPVAPLDSRARSGLLSPPAAVSGPPGLPVPPAMPRQGGY